MIHRDLKPENVLVDVSSPEAPIPIVMDFETSKIQALSGVTTATGAGVGTVGYVDPEVTLGRAQPSTASDMFAFGVVMSEVLIETRFVSRCSIVSTLHQ